MTNLLIGIGIGIPICFAAQRFFAFMKKALRERKEKEAKNTEEAMEKMIDRILNKGE